MINVAVIGCGYWGPNLVRNFSENPKCYLKWCCDLHASRLKLIKKRYPTTEVTTDFMDIIKDREIDVVAIATPLMTHYKIAKRALLTGKHVLVEKPFTHSSKTAKELIMLAKKKKLVLIVGHTFTYSPSVIKIGDLISSGEIGDLNYITSTRVHFGHLKPKESVIWDLASHDLSIIFHWMKSSEYTISCSGRDCFRRGYLDTASLSIDFKRGPVVYIFTSWFAPIKVRTMILTGSKKMVFYDDLKNMEKIKIYDQRVVVKEPKSFGEYQLTYRTGNVCSPNIDSYEPLSAEIADLVKSIELGKNPKSDSLLGLQIIRTLEAAEKSLKSNKPIKVKI
ncbi:MAG: Gfo/Idh/MocA family protein [Planctomycetota bacterium]